MGTAVGFTSFQGPSSWHGGRSPLAAQFFAANDISLAPGGTYVDSFQVGGTVATDWRCAIKPVTSPTVLPIATQRENESEPEQGQTRSTVRCGILAAQENSATSMPHYGTPANTMVNIFPSGVFLPPSYSIWVETEAAITGDCWFACHIRDVFASRPPPP